MGKDEQEAEREIKEVAMEVLKDQRKGIFAQVALARLADGARGGIGPEGFVVGAAIVVAGQAKARRGPKDEKRGRERQPAGPPTRFGTEKAVFGGAEDLR